MSRETVCSSPPVAEGIVESGGAFARLPGRLLDWALACWRRVRTLRQLRGLDDRALRDIGMHRASLGPTLPAPHFGDIQDISRHRRL